MKKSFNTLVFMSLLFLSCSDDNDLTENHMDNPKNVYDCELSDSDSSDSEFFYGICVDGTDFALPNETILFAAKFTSIDCEFIWTIESGGMEILNVVNSIDGIFTKSIATVKFNSDFSGEGYINVFAEDTLGNASTGKIVNLELVQ